ncbi:MAG: nucleoside-diphosphate sugar epimerase/dehydratase [Candidatus Limnocylindrales bacterium]
MTADFLGAVALFVALSIARYGSAWQEAWTRLGGSPWFAAAAFGAGWVALVWFGGLYRVRARWSVRSEAIGLLRATAGLLLATITVLFVIRISDASRLLIGVLFIALAVSAILSRAALRSAFDWLRRRGYMTRNVLVVGANPAGQDFADLIERHSDLGLTVIGHLAGPDEVAAGLTRPVIGRLDEIETVLHREVVDQVAVCLTGYWAGTQFAMSHSDDWRHVAPTATAGADLTEFRLSHDLYHLPVPVVAAAQDPGAPRLLDRPEMAPFRVGGRYDRPIPRRLAEEAGIPRGTFAVAKRMTNTLFQRDGPEAFSQPAQASLEDFAAREVRPLIFRKRAPFKRRERALIAGARMLKLRPLVGGLERRRERLVHFEPEFGNLVFRWAVSVVRPRYQAVESFPE